MTRGTVGIAIPAYKRGRFLASTLESALAQTRAAAEIVVVDDCSPDETAAVAHAFASRGVRYVRNATNLGVPANYNASIARLQSDYVLILEDHDLLEPTFIERCAAILDEHPDVNVVFTGIAEIDDQDRVLRENHFKLPTIVPSRVLSKQLVTMVGAIFGLTAVIRRSALEGLYPYFDPKYWAYADIYLWIRLALSGPAGHVPEPLLKMRVREAGHHLEEREWDSALCVDRIKRDCWRLVYPTPTLESMYRWSVYRLKQDRQAIQQMVADIARGREFDLDKLRPEVYRYFTPAGRVLARAISALSPEHARVLRRVYQRLVVAPVVGTRRVRRRTRTELRCEQLP